MAATDPRTLDPTVPVAGPETPERPDPAPLERRGRRWIFGYFALCPCHLPLTLGILVAVFGGTAAGALLRDHAVIAGAVITAAWVAGTWRGFRLVRLAQQGACPLPVPAAGHATSQDMTFGPANAERPPGRMSAEPVTGRSLR